MIVGQAPLDEVLLMLTLSIKAVVSLSFPASCSAVEIEWPLI
jgi:hypothetical protein